MISLMLNITYIYIDIIPMNQLVIFHQQDPDFQQFFCVFFPLSSKAANTTNTSAHAGYFQQLSADVAKEGARILRRGVRFLLLNNRVGSLITKYIQFVIFSII